MPTTRCVLRVILLISWYLAVYSRIQGLNDAGRRFIERKREGVDIVFVAHSGVDGKVLSEKLAADLVLMVSPASSESPTALRGRRWNSGTLVLAASR